MSNINDLLRKKNKMLEDEIVTLKAEIARLGGSVPDEKKVPLTDERKPKKKPGWGN